MRQTVLQRIIALVLLMAYTITGTTVMPAALVVAAWADGSHGVSISISAEGTHVRLFHRSDDFTPAVADHSGALARVIVSICGTSKEGDHQIDSARLNSTASVERVAFAPTVVPLPLSVSPIPWHLNWGARPRTMEGELRRAFIKAQVAHPGIRSMLATIQLLI